MTTKKQTARRLLAIATATLALLASSSIAQAYDPAPPSRDPPDVCDQDGPNCGEVPDICERRPWRPGCDGSEQRWLCSRQPDECSKPVEPKPCGPNEYCRQPEVD